ncbi:hypothetical protein AB0J68_22395 [Micromonospora sp. NPDC049580]|uniref:hypothetical protein n=1 Tax=Micromonospora sp. NPDC049580 TaxID=3154832 RepID=UPI0034235FB6
MSRSRRRADESRLTRVFGLWQAIAVATIAAAGTIVVAVVSRPSEGTTLSINRLSVITEAPPPRYRLISDGDVKNLPSGWVIFLVGERKSTPTPQSSFKWVVSDIALIDGSRWRVSWRSTDSLEGVEWSAVATKNECLGGACSPLWMATVAYALETYGLDWIRESGGITASI